MSSNLITYSIVKALYDRGLDYIDAFWPFLLEVLPRNGQPMQIGQLQQAIEQRFGLTIPQHALNTIARRAKKRGFLTIPQGSFAATQKGVKHVEALETEREVQRRINEMLEDARRYLFEHHSETLDREQLRTAIGVLISENLELFSPLVGGVTVTPSDTRNDQSLERQELLLIEYFEHVESNNVRVFQTLSDLVAGSILATSLNTDSFAESGLHFEPTTIYLDTNVAFCALELDHEEVNRPVRELLELLRRARVFKIAIFDFTVAEAVGVLQNYGSEYRSYIPTVKVRHIYSSLRTKGWTPADVREFTAGIDDTLSEKDIHVITTGVQLREYKPGDPHSVPALEKYKPGQGSIGQKHDLAAIEFVSKLRKRNVRRIQQAREIFLTSDFGLAQYAYVERGHQQNNTISEVIPDRLLTNLIWLKSPALLANLSLDSFISMHSRELLIDREVWQRFYRSVRSLRESGGINQRDVDVLLYDRHVLDSLRIVPADAADVVDEQFVLESLEAAHESVQAESDTKAQLAADQARDSFLEQADETLQRTLEKFHLMSQDRDQLIAEAEERRARRAQHKATAEFKLRERSQRQAMTSLLILKIVLMSVLSLVLYAVARVVVNNWNQIEPLIWTATVALGAILAILGIKVDALHVWQRLQRRFENRFYEARVKDVWILFEDGYGDGDSAKSQLSPN